MDNALGLSIRYALTHIPVIMLILALIIGLIAMAVRGRRGTALKNINTFLSYMMLLAVGISGIWGFISHAFFPTITAKFIGWQNSPFQFEVAMANLGVGLIGLVGFHASQGFRAATTIMVAIFFWGAAAGHIRQMVGAHNFAPGNAGAIFYTDILIPLILIILMLMYRAANRRTVI